MPKLVATLTALLLAPVSSHALWAISKTAERLPDETWKVGCHAAISGGIHLLWDNRIHDARAAEGNPFKPVVTINTAVTQLESRPVQGTVFGEACTVSIPTFEFACEPASVEHRMVFVVTGEHGETRRMDIWVQPVSVGYEIDPLAIVEIDSVAALDETEYLGRGPGPSVGMHRILEFAVWGDWPDDLLAGDATFVWKRGGTSESEGYWPVVSSGVLTSTAQLRRQYGACVQSHLQGGRVLSREPNRRHLIDRAKDYADRAGW